MGSRGDELRQRFEGQRLDFIKMGYKREMPELGTDEFGRAVSVTYSVDADDLKLILAGYACYECGLIFRLGGLPAVLPTCPLCGKDQTERHAVVTPEGW